MGERISESIVQVNNNSTVQNVEGIYENEAEEQPVDDNSVLNNTATTGEVVTMSSGRFSHAPTCLIEEMGGATLTAAK